MSSQIQRNWQFTEIKWVWHVYQLNDIDLKKYIDAVMYKPIRFSSKNWQLFCQNQVPNGSYVKQTTIIPCNSESLSQIVVIFLSN